MDAQVINANRLVMDGQTFRDLEVFSSDTDGATLFDFCDFTHTEGGSRALQRRMEQPWSSARDIKATQQSIKSILAHHQEFTELATLGYTTNRVEHYTHEPLPVVAHEGYMEFSVAAYTLWWNHERHYHNIVIGVQFACRLVEALQRFVSQVDMEAVEGELHPLMVEMQSLLTRPRLANLPESVVVGGIWITLRLDQTFRFFEKDTLKRLLQLTYEIDALVSLADATEQHGFVLPEVEDGPLFVEAEGIIHPFVHEAVANPLKLNQEHRVLFLTGPNMAGKTTYLRAFATALYLAQLGMGVPAASFRFSPAERLFSSISLTDDIRRGISYFRAEALRIKVLAESISAGYKVIGVLDEPFKGTNVKDALDASQAILQRFSRREDCLFVFSSHLIELSERLTDASQIDCRFFEAEEGEGRLNFDYVLRQGVSSQRLGMRVLKEEGIFYLLDGELEGDE